MAYQFPNTDVFPFYVPERDFGHLTLSSAPEEFTEYGAHLSMKHAVEGVIAVPPITAHYEQAHVEGTGPSLHIMRTVGISAVQAELGFITEEIADMMTREQWVQNGIWIARMLGRPRRPTDTPLVVMPEMSDIGTFSKLRLGPSVPRLRDVFGTLREYQDALGFVTSITLERWTKQDLIDNGVWLSHMLGSPEKPKKLNTEDLQQASIINIAAPEYQIARKFGNQTEYLHIVNNTEKLLDHSSWRHGRFVLNGMWFSHLLGTPEAPRMPIGSDISEGARHGLTPSRRATLAEFDNSLSVYQDEIGFVTEATFERWTKQDWIDNGVWLSHLAGTPAKPARVTLPLLNAASKANLGPRAKRVEKEYPGGLQAYRKDIAEAHQGLHQAA